MKHSKLILSVIGISVATIVVAAAIVSAVLLTKCYKGEERTYVYLTPDVPKDSVCAHLQEVGVRTTGFNLLSKMVGYKVRPGRYAVECGDNIMTLFRRLRNGQQEPINLTIPSVRTLDRLASFLGEHLMIDSIAFEQAFTDSAFCARLGYTHETLPALFIPNTYQVYWTISIDEFMSRMQREYKTFWNKEREQKATALNLTHEEISTLASIIDEETANNGEKPMVAGMYIKRLEVGMPLQADPTVKFALGDFSLRRIWGRHLTVDSPYNTYKNEGLPPGPIRIPSVAGIDAVLNCVHHDYLYMCAKEDFSGTHNFAKTYPEHLQNARRYTKALNERNIK
ncbi:MAG: endolytic transglycosylase MltG [Prevotella sp.]|nr:endolytic transglycosylase MltG [Prevotella sp.]